MKEQNLYPNRPQQEIWNERNESPDRRNIFRKDRKRSFMYCSAERRKTEKLVDLIETIYEDEGALILCDTDGTRCFGTVVNGDEQQTQCSGIRVRSDLDKPRTKTIVRLNHGTVLIVVIDWICMQCRHVNRYVGYDHGIFPASPGIYFTTKLMYYWMYVMCGNTRSFSSVYSSTRSIQFTASYDRRYETNRMSKMGGIHKQNRRAGNYAIRRFTELIDLDNENVAGRIFS